MEGRVGSILDSVVPRAAPDPPRVEGGRARGEGPPGRRRPDNVAPPARRGAASGGDDESAADLAPEAQRALALLTTDTSECAKRHAAGKPCMSGEAVGVLASFIVKREGPASLPAESDPAAVVDAAKKVLKCATETCLLANPGVQAHAAAVGARGLPARELAQRFKPPGPRDSLALLSNYDIDAVLEGWRREFPAFHACPFAMMDFDTNGDAFGRADLAALLAGPKRSAETFGCVVNTDRSTGPGKHWVAVFVDARPGPGAPWSVEYFNSAGNPPPPAMAAWMERSRAALAAARGPGEAVTGGAAGAAIASAGAGGKGAPPQKAVAVAVTDLAHQESQTECGLYALFYIRRRLEGAPYEDFFRHQVPDAAMTAFRRHVFRPAA